MSLHSSRAARARVIALVLGVLAAVTVSAGAGPAHATNPYRPGGGPGLRFYVDSPGVTFTTVPSGVAVTCTTFALGGAVETPGLPRPHAVRAGYVNTYVSGGCGATTITASGTWDLLVTGDGGPVWPVRIRNTYAYSATTACSFAASGDVIGTFNTATQKFIATGSTLVLSSVTGPNCVALGIFAGDGLDVTGRWTNVPPNTGPFTITH